MTQLARPAFRQQPHGAPAAAPRCRAAARADLQSEQRQVARGLISPRDRMVKVALQEAEKRTDRAAVSLVEPALRPSFWRRSRRSTRKRPAVDFSTKPRVPGLQAKWPQAVMPLQLEAQT